MKKSQIILILLGVLAIVGLLLWISWAKKTVDKDRVNSGQNLPVVTGSSVNGNRVDSPAGSDQSSGENSKFSNSVFDASLRKDGIVEATFSCSKDKQIAARFYTSGDDPRADITLIDNATSTDGQINESRRLILKQRPAVIGTMYATDSGSIIFTVDEDDARIQENNRYIFSKCKLTSAK